MSETMLTTVWDVYDPERHAAKGGNYMFLLKDFRNAPYYSGEAVHFANRLTGPGTSHKNLFAAGRRTFMRNPFIDESKDHSHAGFAARWAHYKQQDAEEQERLIWVPKDNVDDQRMGAEAKVYLESKISLLVSVNEEKRLDIEKRVQVDIMDYYDELFGQDIDWCLPKRSRLVGHGPDVAKRPILSYQFQGEQPQGPHEFFGKLQELKA